MPAAHHLIIPWLSDKSGHTLPTYNCWVGCGSLPAFLSDCQVWTVLCPTDWSSQTILHVLQKMFYAQLHICCVHLFSGEALPGFLSFLLSKQQSGPLFHQSVFVLHPSHFRKQPSGHGNLPVFPVNDVFRCGFDPYSFEWKISSVPDWHNESAYLLSDCWNPSPVRRFLPVWPSMMSPVPQHSSSLPPVHPSEPSAAAWTAWSVPAAFWSGPSPD